MKFRHTILILGACCVFTNGCVDSAEEKRMATESANATALAAQRDAAEAARETEWGTIQVNSQPQGASIERRGSSGWESLGYAPVTVNVVRHKDDGSCADYYLFRAIPTAPGEFQQIASVKPGSNYNDVTFFMYNNGQ
jgi:hypothetical protein